MNCTYAYDTQQASCFVTNRIYSLLEHYGWSVKTLSDESNIPYETLKKLMNRKIENTSVHNIIKIASALQCQVDYLVNEDSLQTPYSPNSLHNQNITTYLTGLDLSCQYQLPFATNCYVPVYQPHSLTRRLSFEPTLDLLDISSYPEELRCKIEFGLTISTHSFHPICHYHDVLLMAADRFPHNGEFAVFTNEDNLYFRKYFSYSEFVLLEPVNGLGENITLTDLSTWEFLGYVIGIHRCRYRS